MESTAIHPAFSPKFVTRHTAQQVEDVNSLLRMTQKKCSQSGTRVKQQIQVGPDRLRRNGSRVGVGSSPGKPGRAVLGSIDDYLDPIAHKDYIAAELTKAKAGTPGHLIGSADAKAAANAPKIAKEPGYTDLIVHCDDDVGVFFIKTPQGDIALTPKEVADYVKSLNLPPNEGVRLISCNAGYSPAGPGAALHKELGRPMKVAPAPVAIETDGSLHFVNPGIVNGKYSIYDPNLKWTDLP